MKKHGPTILPLLISLVFPSSIILIADRAIGESGLYKAKDGEGYAQSGSNTHPANPSIAQSFRMAEELVGRIGSGSLKSKDDAQGIANDGLRTILPHLLAGDAKHAQQLGFEMDVIDQDIELLPNVFPIYEVGLNQLHAFTPNINPKALLTYSNQLLLPIGTNKRALSSVTVRFISSGVNEINQPVKNEGWRPARWGRPNLIRRLMKEQKQLKTQGFLVSIPSLNRNFLGYEDDNVIKLIPLAKDYLFEAGESYLASDVFKQISAEAMGVDGSPR